MKKKILPILGLMALSLAACGEREVTLKDYEKTLDIFAYKDTVRIMQIADLHWSMNTDYQAEKRYITKLVAEVDPDIIISTGDNVLSQMISSSITRKPKTLNMAKKPKAILFIAPLKIRSSAAATLFSL